MSLTRGVYFLRWASFLKAGAATALGPAKFLSRLVDDGEVPLLGKRRDGAGDGGGAVGVGDRLLGAHELGHFFLDLISRVV